MTEKKERILQSALKLFAEQGYKGTTTSNIAKQAKVSEALIFRHFDNKEGLLKAVLEVGEEKAKLLYADIILETDAKKLIRKALELPFLDYSEEEKDFWRLQFKIKWEVNYQWQDKAQPLEIALRHAFEQLGYVNAAMEAKYVVYFINGVSGSVLRGEEVDKKQMKSFLFKKYNLV